MPLSIAGRGLPLIGRSDLEKIEAAIDPRDVLPWAYRAFPGARLAGITWPTGFDPAPRARLNRLWWPRGASRWSTFHALAGRDDAEAIREEASGDDGTEFNAVKLKMGTPGLKSVEPSVSAQMYLMPPAPIARPPDGKGGFANGCYLLTLVDARYFWWQVPCPALAIDGTSATWAGLFPLFATALGIPTITVDAIPAAYRLPSAALNLANEPLPIVLDAVCANVGMRLVRNLDGTVNVISAATAATRRSEDDAAYPLRTLSGGGSFFLDTL